MSPVSRCVFFDRDGILNHVVDRGDGTIGAPRNFAEFEPILEGIELTHQLAELGFKVFVATNQPDIDRGLLSRDELALMHDYLRSHAKIDEIFVATSSDSGNPLRKPNPGMIFLAQERHGIDLSRSFFIGDRKVDMQAARNAGVKGILYRRPYNQNAESFADFTVEVLPEILNLPGIMDS